MKSVKHYADLLTERPERVFGIVLLAAVISAVVVISAYAINFNGDSISSSPAEWGQLGDYVGGLLNPLFGFLSVFSLLVTLVLQNRELKLSRAALEISQEELRLTREEQAKAAMALIEQNRAINMQRFEQTFFAWLTTYRNLVDNIRLDSGGQYEGTAALLRVYTFNLDSSRMAARESQIALGPDTSNPIEQALSQIGVNKLKNVQPERYPYISDAAMRLWQETYQSYEVKLDSFYRVLFRLIKWIDEQPDSRLTWEDKWLYVGIVRSQLSWVEMVFLFYNGMTPAGKKFKGLINRYALFDNLSLSKDLLLQILRNHPMDVEGYKDSAFSSDVAKADHTESDKINRQVT